MAFNAHARFGVGTETQMVAEVTVRFYRLIYFSIRANLTMTPVAKCLSIVGGESGQVHYCRPKN